MADLHFGQEGAICEDLFDTTGLIIPGTMAVALPSYWLKLWINGYGLFHYGGANQWLIHFCCSSPRYIVFNLILHEESSCVWCTTRSSMGVYSVQKQGNNIIIVDLPLLCTGVNSNANPNRQTRQMSQFKRSHEAEDVQSHHGDVYCMPVAIPLW